MLTSQHTPGPWHYRSYYRGGFQIHSRTGEPIRLEGPSGLEANARLIAAAPEMLECLKGLLPFVTFSVNGKQSSHRGDCTPVKCAQDCMVATIRTLLARIGGEK